jgi:hypothetical protein
MLGFRALNNNHPHYGSIAVIGVVIVSPSGSICDDIGCFAVMMADWPHLPVSRLIDVKTRHGRFVAVHPPYRQASSTGMTNN